MQDKKLTRAKKVIDALRNHYGDKVGEFAKRLGVAASTVSTWANRDSLDEDLIFRKCEGVNFDFLTTGEGEMFTQLPPSQPHGLVSESNWLTDDQRKLLDLWKAADEDARDYAITILEKAAAKSRGNEGRGSNCVDQGSALK